MSVRRVAVPPGGMHGLDTPCQLSLLTFIRECYQFHRRVWFSVPHCVSAPFDIFIIIDKCVGFGAVSVDSCSGCGQSALSQRQLFLFRFFHKHFKLLQALQALFILCPMSKNFSETQVCFLIIHVVESY